MSVEEVSTLKLVVCVASLVVSYRVNVQECRGVRVVGGRRTDNARLGHEKAPLL